jgi:hypothetical protein
MSGRGNAYDNAMMKSFFATLKTECVDRRYATRAEARLIIFEYLEVFYNNLRRHSPSVISALSPLNDCIVLPFPCPPNGVKFT